MKQGPPIASQPIKSRAYRRGGAPWRLLTLRHFELQSDYSSARQDNCLRAHGRLHLECFSACSLLRIVQILPGVLKLLRPDVLSPYLLPIHPCRPKFPTLDINLACECRSRTPENGVVACQRCKRLLNLPVQKSPSASPQTRTISYRSSSWVHACTSCYHSLCMQSVPWHATPDLQADLPDWVHLLSRKSPHAARFRLSSSRSKVAVTKPSTWSGAGCMLPSPCATSSSLPLPTCRMRHNPVLHALSQVQTQTSSKIGIYRYAAPKLDCLQDMLANGWLCKAVPYAPQYCTCLACPAVHCVNVQAPQYGSSTYLLHVRAHAPARA